MGWLAEWDCFVKVVAEGSMATAARRGLQPGPGEEQAVGELGDASGCACSSAPAAWC